MRSAWWQALVVPLLLASACNGTSASNSGDDCMPGTADCECLPSGGCRDGANSCIDGICAAPTSDEGMASTDGGTDGGCETECPADVGSGADCDIWDPDSCPEGQKCTFYSDVGVGWDGTKCVPIMGDKKPGEQCSGFGPNPGYSGLDDCADGGLCFDVLFETQAGYCVPYCTGSSADPKCPPSSSCLQFGNGFAYCGLHCDPLGTPNGCPRPEDLCLWVSTGEGFVCAHDASGGIGSYGANCAHAGACNQGLFCGVHDALPGCGGNDGCCVPLCELLEPNTCPDQNLGVACVPWAEDPPVGYEHVGRCELP